MYTRVPELAFFVEYCHAAEWPHWNLHATAEYTGVRESESAGDYYVTQKHACMVIVAGPHSWT